ncbi:MAG TPA: heavy-metal-associated domain-containing protein [Candidatus Poseidoniales archaeon]|nr:hypothetical protein [Euryarchaeota archaeon]DAC30937.1 MAG TPA: heavy-metal-associated domain-containing protein [Candidatus Poseidoniales archaeon]|tara:strand:- start:1015 stop:1230 length:216 start_codon:yes stop_codon:yes gene_type:complete
MVDRTYTMHIGGMTCDGCSGRVSSVLLSTPGIIEAKISHNSNSGVIVAHESFSSREIIKIIQSTGYEANEK